MVQALLASLPQRDPDARRRQALFARSLWAMAVAGWAGGFPMFLYSMDTRLVSGASLVYVSWGLLALASAPSVFRRRELPIMLPIGTAAWCGSLGLLDDVYRQTTSIVLVALFAMTGLAYGRRALIPVGLVITVMSAAEELSRPQRASVSRLTALALSLLIVGAFVILSTRHEDALRARIEELLDEQQRLAERDELTGALNRRGFAEQLPRIIASAGSRAHFGLLLVDLDLFKPINDLHGHHVGDLVLRETAARLSSLVPGNGAVARLGGDEFVIAYEVLPPATLDTLRDQAESLIGHPIVTPVGPLTVGASIGAALLADASDTGAVIARADADMYARKRRRHESSSVPRPEAAAPVAHTDRASRYAAG